MEGRRWLPVLACLNETTFPLLVLSLLFVVVVVSSCLQVSVCGQALDMSYSFRKLKFFIDDADGSLRKNQEAAEKFFLAEDDNEMAEMTALMAPEAHFSSFWGVTRGERAARAVVAQEREHMRIVWTSQLLALTNRTFSREGYMQLVRGSFISSIPVFGEWLTQFNQKKVREVLVVRNGEVVFRDLGYRWGLAKF